MPQHKIALRTWPRLYLMVEIASSFSAAAFDCCKRAASCSHPMHSHALLLPCIGCASQVFCFTLCETLVLKFCLSNPRRFSNYSRTMLPQDVAHDKHTCNTRNLDKCQAFRFSVQSRGSVCQEWFVLGNTHDENGHLSKNHGQVSPVVAATRGWLTTWFVLRNMKHTH